MTGRVQIVEPFSTGSHKYWAERIQEHSSWEIDLNTLPGRHWKWRMSSGCIDLAKSAGTMPEPDIFLCSDMLDLAAFKGLLPTNLSQKRFVLYMHENQLVYPQLNPNEFDRQYAFIIFRSALAADELWFNSAFHLEAFIGALPDFLKAFPDKRNTDRLDDLRDKPKVIPLGIDEMDTSDRTVNDVPHILWNHRWEHDKDPDGFFDLLYRLSANDLDFRLIVLGESYGIIPDCFVEAKERLADKIVHWGFAPRDSYERWLLTADILPVTSQQEYFGLSVMEAVHAGVTPILPRRLVYPELYKAKDVVFFSDEDELFSRCAELINAHPHRTQFDMSEYAWGNVIQSYDRAFSKICHG